MSSHSIYAIKDPHLHFTSFLEKVFLKAGITLLLNFIKTPDSVAKSLEARDNISKRDAVRLWTFYNNKALAKHKR